MCCSTISQVCKHHYNQYVSFAIQLYGKVYDVLLHILLTKPLLIGQMIGLPLLRQQMKMMKGWEHKHRVKRKRNVHMPHDESSNGTTDFGKFYFLTSKHLFI